MRKNRGNEAPKLTMPVAIPEGKFKDIQIAILTREVTRQNAMASVQRAVAEVGRAMQAAGLDPTKDYQFDNVAFTATEVVK